MAQYGLMHTLAVLTTLSDGTGLTTSNLPASSHAIFGSALKLFDFFSNFYLQFRMVGPVLGQPEIRHCSLVHNFADFILHYFSGKVLT